MMEFARELYLRSSPNRSAWSATLDSFLRGRGYHLASEDSIRRKFTKACRYYSLLLAETDVYVRKQIRLLSSCAGPIEGDSVGAEEDEWEEVDEELTSDYLAWSCQLCFGACAEHDDQAPADLVVCLDANFVQKRRSPSHNAGRDGPVTHPRSAFLTESEVDEARCLVEAARPVQAQAADTLNDAVEAGMKVSRTVLDACSDSFKAADEKRTKASTKHFADTGLMALLCRHDRVLWLANMTTPGERQFYAIALIIKLFRSIPPHFTVGVLYDIGCQLHRSCTKWGFIPEYIDRIIWGISIFHAYGHQWPCQLIYHPRKCAGFGLSDGEGCERFWSSIQGLVPSLRVSGYHQRIFALDLQINFLREQGLATLGHWLVRKWKACVEKKGPAIEQLNKSLQSLAQLSASWEDQVSVQTRPLVNATSNLAKKSIKAILDLTNYQKTLAREIDGLDRMISQGDTDGLDDMVELRADLVMKRQQAGAQIRKKKTELGVTDQQNLQRLVSNKYLQVRMQAKAVKDRIQAKLRERMFELERFNRIRSEASASDRRLYDHIQSQVHRHEPSVLNLVQKYNKFCDELDGFIRSRRAPRHAVSPQKLDRASIFSLDVDDPIWNDRGLVGEDIEVPDWLGDDEVREDIRAMLISQRCDEEECYLVREATFLQAWFQKEWALLQQAIAACDNPDLLYYFNLQSSHLLYIGGVWKEQLKDSPLVNKDLNWGPTAEDFDREMQVHKGVDLVNSDDDASSIGSFIEEFEDDLVEELEMLHLDTGFANGDGYMAAAGDEVPSSPEDAPKRKRGRTT
ncbi:hypothetical protein EST38_g13285 [Candolleomyces aberdarensis]|uniref:CxC1-like cysteine cluster associated with KDZ transposases domain-containing protein n=1 Tax=Candolleomyces aberdarensis TaxID=2316362 RepID=A0A4Q2D115_9AGAR|nr:hypothetical protein EST38_g13285 [Candolleomyces aberdarensis]